jgi:YD repeat-containing protein
MGQYTTWPRGPLEWDDNGNLVSMATASGPLSFTHDVEGRLVSVSRSGAPVVSYDYDPLGRCISRTPATGAASTFVYDGEACVQELDSLGAPVATFVNDGHEKVGFTTATGETYYPHASGRSRDKGQTWELYPRANRGFVTGPTGAVVERYDCDDAGKPIFLTAAGLPSGAAQSSLPFRWMAPECAWEPEIAMFHCSGEFVCPDLDLAASSAKIKPGPPKSGHEYVGHVTLIR